MFASPFVGELRGGHVDAVNVLSTSRTNLLPVVSGGIDGSVRIWDLQNRKMVKSLEAHGRCVSGVVFGNGIEGLFYSCGEDGVVKGWCCYPRNEYITSSVGGDGDNSDEDSEGYAKKPSARIKTNEEEESPYGPFNVYRVPAGRGNANSSLSFTSIDHHWSDSQFATSSSDAAVHLWDPERSTPITSFTNLWGSDDTVTTIRYNPAERSLLAHCSNDRGIGLHDTRASSALQKSILSMKSNSLEWNPMEPYMFVVGNEDYNAYTFDMRKLNRPTQMFKGHVAAVMSVSWSPTGTEFVTGSYDKTMRIFNVRKEGGTASHTGTNATGVARDIYHTKRMQRIFCTAYTLDHKFILSGSDDTNIRLWKARSSEKMGQLSAREESSLQYRQALVQKYVHLPEVKKIAKARRVPKFIKKQTEMERVQKEKRRRKEGNVVKHSKPGTKGFTDDKGKSVVKTVD
jgi:WD repeat and SOF domain-containing protein 1|eukprot:g2055.t1 g2055   contig11:622969-624339(-)